MGDRRSGSGVLREVLECRAYRWMVRTEHRRSGGGDPPVVAASLVPIAELLGDTGQVVDEGQHQGVVRVPAMLTRGVRLLEHPTRGERVVGLPVQPGQQVRGVEHVRVVFPVRRAGRLDNLGQHPTSSGQVARGTQRECPVLHGGQRGGMGHKVMLPVDAFERYPDLCA